MDTDQKREDEVLRRMLATKPKPHKTKPEERFDSRKTKGIAKRD